MSVDHWSLLCTSWSCCKLTPLDSIGLHWLIVTSPIAVYSGFSNLSHRLCVLYVRIRKQNPQGETLFLNASVNLPHTQQATNNGKIITYWRQVILVRLTFRKKCMCKLRYLKVIGKLATQFLFVVLGSQWAESIRQLWKVWPVCIAGFVLQF